MPRARERAQKAFDLVYPMGVGQERLKTVLKELLVRYNKNWELIEADNYQVLLEALFEPKSEDEGTESKKMQHEGSSSRNGIRITDQRGLMEQNEVRHKRDEAFNRELMTEYGMEILEVKALTVAHPGDELPPEVELVTEISPSTSGFGMKTPVHPSETNKGGAGPSNSYFLRTRSSKQLRNYSKPKHDESGSRHDVNDLSRGQEKIKITVVNEVNNEEIPITFHYIRENTLSLKAHIGISMCRIGDEDWCRCVGDCLERSIPCECAGQTTGVYAYTQDGLLTESFLEYSISLIQESHDRLFFCQECPHEKQKNKLNPEPCKGHLVIRFIKECWRKCGCDMQCGNRVVQRGITRNLQVFYANSTKGWGLRCLDELPKGAFVCEYVGEILTNNEQDDRIKETHKQRHTYPCNLDADWGSEKGLEDEHALCLDGTYYGNVARFINHSCGESNLIGIPVEIETPDHHYYHLAYFTTRKIEALEELTWDYKIDFNDHAHPIKAFRCCCGSQLCRDNSRSKGKRRAS